tara:strand:+ start:965 stop:1099 length:135 start_codon:yes stop_codon:yes gene_type:complete
MDGVLDDNAASGSKTALSSYQTLVWTDAESNYKFEGEKIRTYRG